MASWPSGKNSSQDEVFAFLSKPTTHHMAVSVKRIDTHGASVFLAGNNAYKVKRAIRYPYMDYSTPEKRRIACEAEIEVNNANAPSIYLGAIPITRDAEGLHISGAGDTIEWAVHMRRFDENATLDCLADRGLLDPALIDSLAQTVSEAHQKAPRGNGLAAVTALHGIIDETLQELEDRRDVFSDATVALLRANLTEAHRKNEMLLSRRAVRGKVRHCHGDLHLRNIVLLDGRPTLFDAIEFDKSLATIDVLYDLAFLVMDLCERGLPSPACRLLNQYLWLSDDEIGDIEGLALLPLFLGLRAAIRAKVLVAQSALTIDPNRLINDARKYADAALRFLTLCSPRLIAVGGLSGTGKSALAAALAVHFGNAPGALHLRSDVERKNIYHVSHATRLSPEAYSQNASAGVYRRLYELTEAGLRAGRTVIVDATFLHEAERGELARLATHLSIPFSGLWLEAAVETLISRVNCRHGDASDATAEVIMAQAAQTPEDTCWRKLDASLPPELVVAAAVMQLSKDGPAQPSGARRPAVGGDIEVELGEEHQ